MPNCMNKLGVQHLQYCDSKKRRTKKCLNEYTYAYKPNKINKQFMAKSCSFKPWPFEHQFFSLDFFYTTTSEQIYYSNLLHNYCEQFQDGYAN